MLSRNRQGIRRRLVRRVLCLTVFVAFGLGAIWHTEPAPAESAEKKEIAPPYDQEIRPLTTYQCGRCHRSIYEELKNEGGKHRIDCQRCHETFHNYRPGKVEYEDILPNCETCHGQIHGSELAECAGCHEAHAPMYLPADRRLEQGCHVCHSDIDKEMKTYVTQHTEFYCSTCHHTRHRHIPECMECHQPHTREQTQEDCLSCHPPHKALQVVYPQDVAQEACAGCHAQAYNLLKESGTKHTGLSCAKCHPNHRAIIPCQECHPGAHRPEMLERFPSCGWCHGAAHSLSQ